MLATDFWAGEADQLRRAMAAWKRKHAERGHMQNGVSMQNHRTGSGLAIQH
jgi:DNA polymerase III alpha subunit